MPDRPRRIFIPLLTLAATVLVVASVVSSAPVVCGACHAMKPYAQAQLASAHRGVTCYSCHLQAGAWDYPGFKQTELLRMYPRAGESTLTGPASRLSASVCLKCHAAVLNGISNRSGLRINHAVCAADDSCDGCHADIAHASVVRWQRQPLMEACVRCHLEKNAKRDCDTCHEARAQRDRLKAGPWPATHGTTWKTIHGLGDLRYCATCHPGEYCTPCHGVVLPHGDDFPARHGKDALKTDSACFSCHDRATLCDACHGLPMPHEAGFLDKHDSVAHSPEDATCMTCHRSADCEACHVVHDGSSEGTSTELPGSDGS